MRSRDAENTSTEFGMPQARKLFRDMESGQLPVW